MTDWKKLTLAVGTFVLSGVALDVFMSWIMYFAFRVGNTDATMIKGGLEIFLLIPLLTYLVSQFAGHQRTRLSMNPGVFQQNPLPFLLASIMIQVVAYLVTAMVTTFANDAVRCYRLAFLLALVVGNLILVYAIRRLRVYRGGNYYA